MAFLYQAILLVADYPILTGIFTIFCGLFIPVAYFLTSGFAPSPFKKATSKRKGPARLTDRTSKDKILKQGFATKKIPQNLDAIVIGSGIGGLSSAAILSKAGKRVLVLEQHDQAGGSCHTFHEKGYEFDTGIHYIGGMQDGSDMRLLLDYLTDNNLEWHKLSDTFDYVHVDSSKTQSTKIPIVGGGFEGYKETLLQHFPQEEKAICGFVDLLEEARAYSWPCGILKMLPTWVSWLLIKSGLINRYILLTQKNTLDVIQGLTDNKTLQTVFAYVFADYGTPPKYSSFFTHATVLNHFVKNGSYYPVGGTSEIAHCLIPTIEESGGGVLVRAPVSKILLDLEGKVIGVCVTKNKEEVNIFAPTVISDAGLWNTFESLLPREVMLKSKYYKPLRDLAQKPGATAMLLFVGLKGTTEELNLSPANHFIYSSDDVDRSFTDYLAMTAQEACTAETPIVFASFPSAKDPTWQQRYPGQSVCTVITLVNWEWFSRWEDQRIMHRGEDYEGLKKKFADQAWEQCLRKFPQLADKVEYFDVGTPLSNKFYLGTPRGEIYGLEHDFSRFSPEMTSHVRAQTDIPGLILTGQDVFSCGFAGALFAGILASSAALNRLVFIDLILKKQLFGQKRDKKEIELEE
ncbi:putative all-trans-retinol 13,14-reductase [Lingula anatina]|uniref:All-trans-retinol 13,14-reductase n=1 Tax=Lingula anatina TaxID=7574 RepID=A0A1S3J1M7_LINAN|nr:putative all-trans-retinol 13,14-reductase [Lingula anatina]|eukprot:XP_013404166.1 putative all-trans-retinol 13,14-reductase [Lingula anatina]